MDLCPLLTSLLPNTASVLWDLAFDTRARVTGRARPSACADASYPARSVVDYSYVLDVVWIVWQHMHRRAGMTRWRDRIYVYSVVVCLVAALGCSIAVRAETTVFFEDFEDVETLLISTGLWTLVGPSADHQFTVDGSSPIQSLFPGLASNHVVYYGNPESMSYDIKQSTIGVLTLFADVGGLDIEEGFYQIAFQSFRNVELNSKSWYDETSVQVRFDTSTEWYTVWCRDSSSEQSVGWEEETANQGVPFPAPEGATKMWVRFVFDSVDRWYNHYFGWMIDDIRIFTSDSGRPIGWAGGCGCSKDNADATECDEAIEQVARDRIRFCAPGDRTEAIRVLVFSLNEALVFEQTAHGQVLEWGLTDNNGELLPNGVYICLTHALIDGVWIQTSIEKLALLR